MLPGIFLPTISPPGLESNALAHRIKGLPGIGVLSVCGVDYSTTWKDAIPKDRIYANLPIIISWSSALEANVRGLDEAAAVSEGSYVFPARR
jgi:hypothetical protein